MKKTNKLISAAVLACFAFASQCISAAENTMTLHVPFPFVVGGRTMPAGAYTVETDGSVVAVRGSTGTSIVSSGPQSAGRFTEPGLIFSRRGNIAYLVGIRTGEDARSISSGALQAR